MTKYFANEYRRERWYKEAKHALRQALVDDEQAMMRVEDLRPRK